jgi:hypothetical protein
LPAAKRFIVDLKNEPRASAEAAATPPFPRRGALRVQCSRDKKLTYCLPTEAKSCKNNDLNIWPLFREKLSASIFYHSCPVKNIFTSATRYSIDSYGVIANFRFQIT